MSAGHGHSHSHGTATVSNERRLWVALALTTAFLIVEVIGGLLTGSLALISDAAHMMTDTAALAIALAAVRVARRPSDRKRTFGYYRFEILAAAFNAVILVFVAAYILYEAYRRLMDPAPVQSLGMLAIAVIGLIVNLVSMRLLQGGSGASLNVKGAYLEVWSDMVGSLGVIVAALLIFFTGKVWIDAVVAAAIGLWVIPRTWLLLKESLNILLEGVPPGIEIDEIERALLAIPGVTAIHDLHVWALTSGKNSLTVHLVMSPEAAEREVLQAASAMLAERFGLRHTTIQVESAVCPQVPAQGAAHF